MSLPFPDDMHALTTQALGLIAWAMGLWAASQKSDARMKGIYAVMCLLLSAHFILLGAFVAAGTVLVTSVRNVTSIFSKERAWALVFILLYLVIGYYRYETPVDLLGSTAACLSTIAFFYLSGLRMRVAMVLVCSLWLTHNILVGSLGASLLEAGNILLIGWRAADMRKNAKNPTA